MLKQRHDQLPALVSAVRGALAFEQDVLTEVARARAAYSPTEPIPEQAVHSDQTTAAVRSLFAVVERYPELHAQQNVLDLQDEIERLEAMIADRRELYNDQVYRYNTRIATMPDDAPGPALRLDAARVLRGHARGGASRPSHGACERRGARPSDRSGSSATARPSGRRPGSTPAGRTSR